MAKQQENNQEPSIEEILDSIRQIISDDDEQAAEAPAAAKPAEDEIIELTERAPAPAPQENIEVEMKDSESPPAPAAAAPPPTAPKPEPKPEPVQAKPAPAVSKKPETNIDTTDNLNSILTKNAEDSVMGAFTELTKHASISKGDGVTVEDVVREELRPMLKQWLDKNLPGLVEKLVQKELERISKRVVGD